MARALPSPEEEFTAALVVQRMDTAPRDSTVIVGRDRSGQIAHIRWRTHPDLDDRIDDPYWARMDSDELFDPIVWVPTTWTDEEMWYAYIG